MRHHPRVVACAIAAALTIALALAAAQTPAAAQAARVCRVADPSPTPTNLRTAPAGDLVGTIANGTPVEIVAEGDGGGRSWALVARPGSAVVAGWVAQSLLKCG